MLQDRGLLVQEGPRYVVTGDVSDLEVPETLQALVASRLDDLDCGRTLAASGRLGARPLVHGSGRRRAQRPARGGGHRTCSIG